MRIPQTLAAASAALLWLGASALPATAQGDACTPVGALHLYRSEHFDVLLPRGVLVKAPGNTGESFYLELGGGSPPPRIDYDHRSGFVQVEHGVLIGQGMDWKIYPATPACLQLAQAAGGAVLHLRATEPADPRYLPPNSITTEGR